MVFGGLLGAFALARFEPTARARDVIIAISVGISSVVAIWLFARDVTNVFRGDNLETSVVTALGSLLIIWMMIELLGTEVEHLRGKKIPIKVFIGIVIVAFIRKVLIGSLQHSSIVDYGTKVGTLLILALVYWLIARADRS